MKRLAALLLTILMTASAALAEIDWASAPAPVQTHLAPYIAQVNGLLAQDGSGVIDMAYEVYPAFVSLGMNGVALPDDPLSGETLPVEMQFNLSSEGLYSLRLSMSDIDRFASVAAACIHAASPASVSLATALTVTRSYAAVAISDRADALRDPAATTHAYEEDVVDLQGDAPRAYFAYAPNKYGDGTPWLQMTLIFPRAGSTGGSLIVSVTPAPGQDTGYIDPEADPDYEGYLPAPGDNVNHLETFATPTPEPDSAAMERW